MAYAGRTYGSTAYGGYNPTGIPSLPPGPTVATVFYLYENVGIATGPDIDAVFYLYENVGVSGFVSPYLGTIHPLLNDMYAVFYLYENVT